MNPSDKKNAPPTIAMPAPTGWPMIAAFGITLVFAGLVTHWLVSLLGALLLILALAGWFRAVLPRESHVMVPVLEEFRAPTPVVEVRQLRVGEANHRARLPLEIYPYSAGLRGGWVAGVAMALLAVLYGLLVHGSIWYPVNLLAAAGSAKIAALSDEQLLNFNQSGLVLAIIIHICGSTLVGLLYGAILPIFSRRPMLVGGIIAPLLWSGLLYSAQDIINPTLNARIEWPWFVVFQVLFGVVAGLVVARHERIYTLQHEPFAVRAGIEAGVTRERHTEDPK